MRLYFFLFLLLPLYLLGQAPDTIPISRTQHKYRIGVSYSREQVPTAPFIVYQNSLAGVPDRGLLLNFQLDHRIATKIPTLLLLAQFQMSYQQMRFSGSKTPSATLAIFGPLAPSLSSFAFSEDIQYHCWQLGLGFQIERAQSLFSPFLAAKMLLALPTHLRYELHQEGVSEDIPGYRLVEGGARLSPGWTMTVGIRVILHPRICLKVGAYVIDQSIRVDWPEFQGRFFKGTVLRVQNTGLSMGAQFGW